jgi:hypothetical protein
MRLSTGCKTIVRSLGWTLPPKTIRSCDASASAHDRPKSPQVFFLGSCDITVDWRIFDLSYLCLLYAPLGGGPMSAGSTTGGQRHLGDTLRRDAWWLELLPVIALLGAFGVYATLRVRDSKFGRNIP